MARKATELQNIYYYLRVHISPTEGSLDLSENPGQFTLMFHSSRNRDGEHRAQQTELSPSSQLLRVCTRSSQ